MRLDYAVVKALEQGMAVTIDVDADRDRVRVVVAGTVLGVPVRIEQHARRTIDANNAGTDLGHMVEVGVYMATTTNETHKTKCSEQSVPVTDPNEGWTMRCGG